VSGLVGAVVVSAVLALGAGSIAGPAPDRRPVGGAAAVVRALELLERRAPGVPPRVRFEWTPRDGAEAYDLAGSWTEPGSWTVRRNEFRVTRRTATSWTAELITFEVSLPPGDHSWRLAASAPSRADPAKLGFELR
jgi:hypothetical protein